MAIHTFIEIKINVIQAKHITLKCYNARKALCKYIFDIHLTSIDMCADCWYRQRACGNRQSMLHTPRTRHFDESTIVQLT